jgi:DDE superfamily endonuclease
MRHEALRYISVIDGRDSEEVLAPDNQTYNALLRAVRCRGERGFALLTGRWRALRRVTASPRRIGDYVKAALVLTHIEQVQLRTSC